MTMQNENRLPWLKNSPNWIVVPMIALVEQKKNPKLSDVYENKKSNKTI